MLNVVEDYQHNFGSFASRYLYCSGRNSLCLINVHEGLPRPSYFCISNSDGQNSYFISTSYAGLDALGLMIRRCFNEPDGGAHRPSAVCYPVCYLQCCHIGHSMRKSANINFHLSFRENFLCCVKSGILLHFYLVSIRGITENSYTHNSCSPSILCRPYVLGQHIHYVPYRFFFKMIYVLCDMDVFRISSLRLTSCRVKFTYTALLFQFCVSWLAMAHAP